MYIGGVRKISEEYGNNKGAALTFIYIERFR